MAPPLRPRAVVFDLDETLIDARRAWEYAVEEALLSITGKRASARALVEDYRQRPWQHVFGVLADDARQVAQCAEAAEAMFHRSALKRLLVHEGIGMGLDRVRAARIEIAVISRQPHARAIRQIESTGLDRFVTVLSPTTAEAPWQPAIRVMECVGYIGCEAALCAFVSAEPGDLREAEALGIRAFVAGWVSGGEGIPSPGDLEAALTRAWSGRG